MFGETFNARGGNMGHMRDVKECMIRMKDHNAITDPSALPARERRRLSVNNWRTRRPLVAPMERRRAISLWRTDARARRRLVTFAHAMSSTRAKAARITDATGIRNCRSSGLVKNVAV